MWCLTSAWGLSLLFAALSPQGRTSTLAERTVWDVVRSEDGDFAFSMPARPTRETRETRGVAGSLEILSYSCASGGSDYRLHRTRSPNAVPPGQVIAQLQRLRNRYLKDGVKLVKETPIVVDGVIGEDLSYTTPSSQGRGAVTARTRHFIHGPLYYVMTVTSPPGQPLPGAAARFLSSLTFEGVVRMHYVRVEAEPKPSARPATRPRSAERPEPKALGSRIRVEPADSTPEDALKTFVLAMAAQDEQTLRAVTMPDDELPRLLRRDPASSDALARMRSRLDRMAMRRLKAGDMAKMADGTSLRLRPDDVRAGRVIIWPEGSAYAIAIQAVKGRWKVITRPFIAARKASEAQRPPPRPASPPAGPGPDR